MRRHSTVVDLLREKERTEGFEPARLLYEKLRKTRSTRQWYFLAWVRNHLGLISSVFSFGAAVLGYLSGKS